MRFLEELYGVQLRQIKKKVTEGNVRNWLLFGHADVTKNQKNTCGMRMVIYLAYNHFTPCIAWEKAGVN